LLNPATRSPILTPGTDDNPNPLADFFNPRVWVLEPNLRVADPRNRPVIAARPAGIREGELVIEPMPQEELGAQNDDPAARERRRMEDKGRQIAEQETGRARRPAAPPVRHASGFYRIVQKVGDRFVTITPKELQDRAFALQVLNYIRPPASFIRVFQPIDPGIALPADVRDALEGNLGLSDERLLALHALLQGVPPNRVWTALTNSREHAPVPSATPTDDERSAMRINLRAAVSRNERSYGAANFLGGPGNIVRRTVSNTINEADPARFSTVGERALVNWQRDLATRSTPPQLTPDQRQEREQLIDNLDEMRNLRTQLGDLGNQFRLIRGAVNYANTMQANSARINAAEAARRVTAAYEQQSYILQASSQYQMLLYQNNNQILNQLIQGRTQFRTALLNAAPSTPATQVQQIVIQNHAAMLQQYLNANNAVIQAQLNNRERLPQLLLNQAHQALLMQIAQSTQLQTVGIVAGQPLTEANLERYQNAIRDAITDRMNFIRRAWRNVGPDDLQRGNDLMQEIINERLRAINRVQNPQQSRAPDGLGAGDTRSV